MNYKASEIKIPNDDPFKNDKLNRKPEVQNLSVLLQNISSPIVFSINAPWGTGKTTFLRMLHRELLNHKKRAIYFSSWETDFAKDPLLAFLGEINEALEEDLKGDQAEAWKKAKKAGVQIIKRSIPALLKVGTAGIIDADELIEKEASQLVESFSKDLVKEYDEKKTAIKLFKDSLSDLLKENGYEKLYIIVDELDRCRPTYAIELLERIKHLLDIDGLVFVLALDRTQLSHSVRGVYGNEFEAEGYLRRFIDIEYTLKDVDQNLYIDFLFEHFSLDEFYNKRASHRALKNEKKRLLDTLKLLIKYQNLSLREIEQIMAKLNLVILATNEDEYTYPPLLAFLLIAKQYYPSLYKNYIISDSGLLNMIELLKKIIPDENQNEYRLRAFIEGFLIAAKSTLHNQSASVAKVLKNHELILDDEKSSEIMRRNSRLVLDVVASPVEDYRNGVYLEHLISRIEMTKQFDI